MAMIIALRVSKEGREAWLEGMGLRLFFILTREELYFQNGKKEAKHVVAYMRECSGQSKAVQWPTTLLHHHCRRSLQEQQLHGLDLKVLLG